MKHLLLIAAAAATAGLATPAAAVDRPGLARAASGADVTVHRGSDRLVRDVRVRGLVANFDRDRDRRRDRGFDGGSYYGDREYQGDTAWRPSGFNDWWHDNPERNMPRWIASNNCERQYWTGAGWRC